MSVKPDLEKRIAELSDGDTWQLADLLAEEYPPDEWEADASGRTGLYEELRQYELALARDYGILLSASTMRSNRATAIAWPRDRRQSRASFEVHKMMRGNSREAEMRKWLRAADREGRALSKRMLSRFRYDEKPTTPRQFDERVRRAIASAARRELLGGIVTKREDWWMAEAVVDEARAVVVRELRALASAIAKGPIGDA